MTPQTWKSGLRKSLWQPIARLWLRRRIREKWQQDCPHLPLTEAHRELYVINHIKFWRELGHFPNLIDCRDYNDRIQWLKLFDQRVGYRALL